MNPFTRYIKKHVLLFVITIVIIFALNVLLYFAVFQNSILGSGSEGDPLIVSEQTSEMLLYDNGEYSLAESQQRFLHENDIWCLLITPDGNVIWNFEAPAGIPLTYTLQDVALFSRSYLKDYPVFVWTRNDGLLVLGYPQSSYAKITNNYMLLNMMQALPVFFVGLILIDILILFIVYMISRRNINKNITPLARALDDLSKGTPVEVKPIGDLSEIGESINRTSEALAKKDQARVNWISGVSHDIRTPLSMILGYADNIVSGNASKKETKEYAEIIRRQSLKIRDLIQDLNLSSKLEYDMQPLDIKTLSLAKIVRGLVAEYLNGGLDEEYSISVDIKKEASTITFPGDERLLKRAIENLVQNSIDHNPRGCRISIRVDYSMGSLRINISDDGQGISEEEYVSIQKLQTDTEHSNDMYGTRRGLGLSLVRRIVLAHNGIMQVESKAGQGFSVVLVFAIDC